MVRKSIIFFITSRIICFWQFKTFVAETYFNSLTLIVTYWGFCGPRFGSIAAFALKWIEFLGSFENSKLLIKVCILFNWQYCFIHSFNTILVLCLILDIFKSHLIHRSDRNQTLATDNTVIWVFGVLFPRIWCQIFSPASWFWQFY